MLVHFCDDQSFTSRWAVPEIFPADLGPYHGLSFVSSEVQLGLFGGLEPLPRGIVSLLCDSRSGPAKESPFVFWWSYWCVVQTAQTPALLVTLLVCKWDVPAGLVPLCLKVRKCL